MIGFAEALERVCVQTVEAGKMTKDLALLIDPDQAWLTTEEFLKALEENLQSVMTGPPTLIESASGLG